MEKIFPLFLENIKKSQLIENGDTVIAGFSGGKDSLTLILVLLELQKHVCFNMVAAYFNHHLRLDSTQEETWVRKYCQAANIELQVGTRDIRRYKEENRLNLEHAASLSRYDFFWQVASRFPRAKIATGHTRSDLAETFFIKLFRGSGLQGLSALYQSKEKKIIRPLLIFSQQEITDFIGRNRLEFYQDQTNLSPDFLRNRIRQQLMPEIKKIEPSAEIRIFNTVSIIQEDHAYLQNEAQTILAENLILKKILPAVVFKTRPLAIQRHLAREYLRHLKGNLLGVGFENIEDFLKQLEDRGGLSLPGVNVLFEKGFVFPENMTIPPYRHPISGEGKFELKKIDKILIVERCFRFQKPRDNNRIIVPATKLTFPLTIRNPRSRDKYQKIHSPYQQKVFEMVRASGFPSALRNLCPVLVNGDGDLIWVCGSPLADPFKVERKSAKLFYLIHFAV